MINILDNFKANDDCKHYACNSYFVKIIHNGVELYKSDNEYFIDNESAAFKDLLFKTRDDLIHCISKYCDNILYNRIESPNIFKYLDLNVDHYRISRKLIEKNEYDPYYFDNYRSEIKKISLSQLNNHTYSFGCDFTLFKKGKNDLKRVIVDGEEYTRNITTREEILTEQIDVVFCFKIQERHLELYSRIKKGEEQ